MDFWTVGQMATSLGVGDYDVRRAVDALGLCVCRVGLYRLIPKDRLEDVRRYLEARQLTRTPRQRAAALARRKTAPAGAAPA
jgi:hypothetical protein